MPIILNEANVKVLFKRDSASSFVVRNTKLELRLKPVPPTISATVTVPVTELKIPWPRQHRLGGVLTF